LRLKCQLISVGNNNDRIRRRIENYWCAAENEKSSRTNARNEVEIRLNVKAVTILFGCLTTFRFVPIGRPWSRSRGNAPAVGTLATDVHDNRYSGTGEVGIRHGNFRFSSTPASVSTRRNTAFAFKLSLALRSPLLIAISYFKSYLHI